MPWSQGRVREDGVSRGFVRFSAPLSQARAKVGWNRLRWASAGVRAEVSHDRPR